MAKKGAKKPVVKKAEKGAAADKKKTVEGVRDLSAWNPPLPPSPTSSDPGEVTRFECTRPPALKGALQQLPAHSDTPAPTRGFINDGTRCYVNAGIALLLNTNDYIKFIEHYLDPPAAPLGPDMRASLLALAIAYRDPTRAADTETLMRRLLKDLAKVEQPHSYIPGQQDDAAIPFGCILQTLREQQTE